MTEGVVGLVRVRAGAPDVFHVVPGGDTGDMARLLVSSAVQKLLERGALPGGVHRVSVNGTRVDVSRVAGAEEGVAVLEVERTADVAARVTGLHVSLADGGSPANGVLERAVAESVASAAQRLQPGQRSVMEIVFAP